MIFYITDMKIHNLIAWSDNPKLLSNYIKTVIEGKFDVDSISTKKFKRLFPNYEEKELIRLKNNIVIREHQDYLETLIDEEYFKLADTIEYLKALSDRYKLSEKEDKKVYKCVDVLKDLFSEFDDYYKMDEVCLSYQSLVELKEQSEHIRNIIRGE